MNDPAEEPQESNHPLDILVEGPGEPEEPQPTVKVPAGGEKQPHEPNNPNPLPEQPPVPVANNQLNWFNFKSDFLGKTQRRCGGTLAENK